MATQVNTYLLAGMGGAGAGAGGVQVRTHGVICQNRRVEVKSGSEPDLVTLTPTPTTARLTFLTCLRLQCRAPSRLMTGGYPKPVGWM